MLPRALATLELFFRLEAERRFVLVLVLFVLFFLFFFEYVALVFVLGFLDRFFLFEADFVERLLTDRRT